MLYRLTSLVVIFMTVFRGCGATELLFLEWEGSERYEGIGGHYECKGLKKDSHNNIWKHIVDHYCGETLVKRTRYAILLRKSCVVVTKTVTTYANGAGGSSGNPGCASVVVMDYISGISGSNPLEFTERNSVNMTDDKQLIAKDGSAKIYYIVVPEEMEVPSSTQIIRTPAARKELPEPNLKGINVGDTVYGFRDGEKNVIAQGTVCDEVDGGKLRVNFKIGFRSTVKPYELHPEDLITFKVGDLVECRVHQKSINGYGTVSVGTRGTITKIDKVMKKHLFLVRFPTHEVRMPMLPNEITENAVLLENFI